MSLRGQKIPATAASVVEQRLTARKVMAIGERNNITPAAVREILTRGVKRT